jgi:hypothetical protein
MILYWAASQKGKEQDYSLAVNQKGKQDYSLAVNQKGKEQAIGRGCNRVGDLTGRKRRRC